MFWWPFTNRKMTCERLYRIGSSAKHMANPTMVCRRTTRANGHDVKLMANSLLRQHSDNRLDLFSKWGGVLFPAHLLQMSRQNLLLNRAKQLLT